MNQQKALARTLQRKRRSQWSALGREEGVGLILNGRRTNKHVIATTEATRLETQKVYEVEQCARGLSGA